MTDDVVIRTAERSELAALPAVEAASGAAFRDLGMDLVADGPVVPAETFGDAQGDDRVVVAVADGIVVGFVWLEPLDGALHVQQISVLPAYGRRGIGSRLMRAAVEVARERGVGRMTLTTYRDVPFNGPFYASLGWSVVPDQEMTPGLVATRRREAAAGLDRWPRQAMAATVRSG